jgi:hypothetical protein
MKPIIITLAILTALLFSGCGNSATQQNSTSKNLLIESDFVAYPTTKANATHQVQLDLEHHSATQDMNDTGEIGVDCFTYNFETPLNLQLLLDENSTAKHMTISDETGIITLSQPGSYSESIDLAANKDYILCLSRNEYHSSTAIQTHFISIVPNASAHAKTDTSGALCFAELPRGPQFSGSRIPIYY